MSDHARQVRNLFDGKAHSWSAKYAPGGSLSRRPARFRLALSALMPSPASVLDLGCGTGELARELCAAHYDIVGADSSPAMLDLARKLSGPLSIEWATLGERWRELPFCNQRFDAVVASSVIEYVEEPGRFIDECGRVLRSQGVFLCTVPNPRHYVRRLEAATLALSHRSPSWLDRLEPSAIRDYLKYLHLSKNRLPISDWLQLAQLAALDAIAVDAAVISNRGPLSLLAFRRRT